MFNILILYNIIVLGMVMFVVVLGVLIEVYIFLVDKLKCW